MGRGASGAAAELWPMAVDMLDRRLVPPGDLFRVKAQCCREALALLGTGRVAVAGNRLDHAPVQPGRLNQLGQVEAPIRHPFAERLHLGHDDHSHGMPASAERSSSAYRIGPPRKPMITKELPRRA